MYPLTVVIPTRDREQRLAETLTALGGQSGLEGGLEVVVVDDGSDPVLEPDPAPENLDLQWIRQGRRGPAAARNRGIAEARAPRVLLLGDDTRPAPGALGEHLRTAAASATPVAVQGHIDWDPEAPVTPLMRFLAPAGPQFYFAGLTAGGVLPYTAVLASNLSAPTAWFREDLFDEGFPDAAFEDTELAYRWSRRGRRTVYAPAALCWHRHHYEELEPFLARRRRAGRAARHALRRHPAMAGRIVLHPFVFGVYLWLRHGLRRVTGRGRRTDGWELRCRWAFFRGLLGGRGAL